ncbi:MAG: ExeA family protein, partial [Gammaproteobacteria bacterium]
VEVDVTVGLITNTHESFGDLMQWVLLAFGLEFKNLSKPEMYRLFTDFIIEQYAQNRRTVLIVDEAQNLNVAALEELRMLSNINVDKHQVLQLILVGQPQLRSSLVRPELTQFAQRVAVDYHIDALDERETKRYVRHRIRHAGGNPIVFRSAAYPAVYRFSRGVPRLINVLCDTALVYAFGENKKRVSEEMIREVVRDRIKGVVFEDRPSKTQGFSYPGLASKLKSGSGDSRVTPLASDQDRDLLRELFPDGTDGL